MRAGLVSVTFRALSPTEIISLVKRAGLEGIEWGGDIHVPPGDIQNARAVGAATREAGLSVACYGSYCRLTEAECEDGLFREVVEAADVLGAPLIRVWAGGKGSADATGEERGAVVSNARVLGDLAAERGLRVAFEYHGGTLTDTPASARRLLDEVDHPSVGTLWQPPVGMSTEDCLDAIALVEGHIENAHVFFWKDAERLPLVAGADAWRQYLRVLPQSHWALLEFVAGDRPEQLIEDAATLKGWLSELEARH